MNPPFTRIERLEDNYKDYLIGPTGVFREFNRYFKGQSGLHCFFLVHIKNFLLDGGRFGAVLPAATFSSEYGNMLKPFILDNYRILYLFAYEKQSTFSVDCDWKEVLLVGVKGKEEAQLPWKAKVIVLKKELEIGKIKSFANQFRSIDQQVDSESYSVKIVPKQEFETEWNWMTFTRPQFLKDFAMTVWNSNNITHQQNVIQFHEGHHIDALYFFRVPNDFWNIEDGEIFVTLTEKAGSRKFNIPKRYLTPTLGLPEHHTRISTEMKNYILNIPESEPDSEIPRSVKDYINSGSSLDVSEKPEEAADLNESEKPEEAADLNESEKPKRIADLSKILKYTKSGNRWFTYGNHILYREDPFNGGKILIGGRIAIVEKFRTKNRKCIAFYWDEQLTGSASYLFGMSSSAKGLSPFERNRSKQEVLHAEKVLAGWFASTIFLALYLYNRREISGDYGRIRIGDMASFPCIDPSLISEHDRQSIMDEVENLMKEELPLIYDQLKTKKLQRLDEAILRAIGIEDSTPLLNNLYTDLIGELDRIEPEEGEVIV